jgi:hypothetical protein
MRRVLETVFVISLAAQTGNALAYSCNNNRYMNSAGHVIHRRHVARSLRSPRRTVETVALAFQSVTPAPARTTAALLIGTEATFGLRRLRVEHS